MCLLELGNEAFSPNEMERREKLKTYMTNFGPAFAGIVFSPCLYADTAQDVSLRDFEAQVREFEDAGIATILEPVADWDAIARLRENIRRDVKANPAAFSHLRPDQQKVGLGDTAVVYAAIRTQCDQLWTYDGLLLALSERQSIRMLRTIEPHELRQQGVLFTGDE